MLQSNHMDKRKQPRPQEVREKIRNTLLGKKHPPDRVEANRLGHLGLKHSSETIAKMKERTPWNKGLATPTIVKEKQRKAKLINPVRYWLGKKRPELTGKNNYLWQGGKTAEIDKLRTGLEYKQWRRAVFGRDNYTCIKCGCRKSGSLEADHIKPQSKFPELRFDINNGRTLCKPCHRKTPTYGRYQNA